MNFQKSEQEQGKTRSTATINGLTFEQMCFEARQGNEQSNVRASKNGLLREQRAKA
jgi:hypothetical protein